MSAQAQRSRPRVSAVIVSFNTCPELLRCLGSLRGVRLPIEIVVVDNGSADDSVERVRREHQEVRVLENRENLGFAAANNRGIAQATSPAVLILNSDAEVRPGAVEAMVEILDARPEVGVVGPRTLNPDGTAQLSFGPSLTPIAEWLQRRRVRAVARRRPRALRRLDHECQHELQPSWVSGSCMLARREALSAVGGFDEGFFLYEEDVDLCLRIRQAGWRVLYTPRAEVIHHLGRSAAREPWRVRLEYHKSHLRYYAKHNGARQLALLRVVLAVRSLRGWLGAWLQAGALRTERMRHHAAVLKLALGRPWSG